MATVYLHIETPKTGTSAIQNFLPQNKELLESLGFCYPDLGYRFKGIGVNRNAHFLVHRQNCTPEEEAEIRENENICFYEGLDKIKELTNTFPNVILSDENIWNGYWKRENFWYELKNAFSERNIDLKIIVYLRRQDMVIESYYVQRVKEKSTYSFEEYINSGKYNYFRLDYYERLENISEIVGKENIIVRVYEKQQYQGNGNTLISDFLNVLGLELDDRFRSSDIVVNTSLHGSCLEVKRLLNEMTYFQNPKWPVKYLRKIQNENEGNYKISKCEYFFYEQRIAFLEKYKEGNAAVAREYMNRADGILFKDEIKKTDADMQYSPRELVLICGRMN